MLFSLILNILSSLAIIAIGFILISLPLIASAQSTSSGDVLPGRGVMIVNRTAVIDSNIVMLAQRAADSIAALKASILTKTTLAAALAAISMTATGSGTPTYNSGTGVINVPLTVTSIGLTSTDFAISGTPVTGSGNIVANLNTSGITAGNYGITTFTSKGIATSGKRLELYSGTTNASGVYTVTFSSAFGAAPNIQASMTNQSAVNQYLRISAVSTTGFTINVFSRSTLTVLGIDLLSSAVTNVNAVPVDVSVTEK